MKDIPIIFSAPMVRALLEGRKTMTRRLSWGKYKEFPEIGQRLRKPSKWRRVIGGDRLWVRETWAPDPMDGAPLWRESKWGSEPFSPADKPIKWRPSIHMPRTASRITLIVTGVKEESLQNISRADCIAEGMTDLADVHAGWHQSFAQLWDKLHGDGAWDENPHVVALSFTVHPGNIDALRKAA